MKKPDKRATGTVRRRRGRPAGAAELLAPNESLLPIAFDMFAEHGYAGTSMRELAGRLGVSHNLLHVRFGSKAELWREAVSARIAAASAPIDHIFSAPYATAEQRLLDLVIKFAEWAAADPALVDMSSLEARHDSWRLDYLIEHYILPFQQRLDALLVEVAKERDCSPLPVVPFMVLLVHGLGSYFAGWPLMRKLEPNISSVTDHIRERAAQFAKIFLAQLDTTKTETTIRRPSRIRGT